MIRDIAVGGGEASATGTGRLCWMVRRPSFLVQIVNFLEALY
jgi:hypothetical protein